MNENNVTEVSYYSITDCLSIIRSQRINKSDAIFIEASKQVVIKNNKDASKSLAFSLQGVKYWYLKQYAKQKEEFVLRDLLLPLLDPLLVQSKGEYCKQFRRYRRFILWCFAILYQGDLVTLFTNWLSEENSTKYWYYQVFILLCLIYENGDFINKLLNHSSSSTANPSLIQVIDDPATPSTKVPYSTLFSNTPFSSLFQLHSFLYSSFLQPFQTEINHRWLLPCYNACLYLLQHYIQCDNLITSSLIEECETCVKYYFIITKNANYLLETVDKHINHLHSFFSGLLSNIDNQKQVCSIRRKEMERDGYDTSELDKISQKLTEQSIQISKVYSQEYLTLLKVFSTRVLTTHLQDDINHILSGLIQTTSCNKEEECTSFYFLFQSLLSQLARLSPSQLKQFASEHDQELFTLCMTTTRFFKHISIQKKDQDTQYEGDIFELILGVARCSIQFSQAAGRVADFTEMLLDQSHEKELQCVRYTVSALLSVCMEKEPVHVCSSLFHRLSQDTSIEITSTFRQYFCHSKKVDDSVRTSVSQHFIQLLKYNHQVHNRLIDDLLACLPYLSNMEMILKDLLNQTVSPDQQESILTCIATILETSNRSEEECSTILPLFFSSSSSFIPLALSKWSSYEGEVDTVATVLWSYAMDHSLPISSLQPWLPRVHSFFYSKIQADLLALPLQTLEEADSPSFLYSLELLSSFQPEWFPSPSSSIPFTSIEATFLAYPSYFQHLFHFTLLQYKNEQVLRLACEAIAHFPWSLHHSFLPLLSTLLSSLLTSTSILSSISQDLLTQSSNPLIHFTIHRSCLYLIQCILRDYSTEVWKENYLNTLFACLLDCCYWYNNKTIQIVLKKEGKEEEWDASLYTRLSSSVSYAMAFILCIEIQEKKPEKEKKIQVISDEMKKLVYLPKIINLLQPYLQYNIVIKEKQDDDQHPNRYTFASILQCLVVCIQSVKKDYLDYVVDYCYSNLILILMNEKDDLMVSLSLSCFYYAVVRNPIEEEKIPLLLHCCIQRLTLEEERCDLCTKLIVYIIMNYEQVLSEVSVGDIEFLKKQLRQLMTIYSNDSKRMIAFQFAYDTISH